MTADTSDGDAMAKASAAASIMVDMKVAGSTAERAFMAAKAFTVEAAPMGAEAFMVEAAPTVAVADTGKLCVLSGSIRTAS
jgi:hypothetical protein